jgi:outer membrane biosynthesis protein TonB
MRQADADSRRKWWFIAAIVLLFHLSLLLFVRPESFDFLLRDIDAEEGSRSSRAASIPDAIIAIQVEVEDAESEFVVETPIDPARPAPPSPPSPTPEPGADRDAPLQSIDVGDILGQAQAPRTGGGTRRGETIPPRPIEITWPETRRLRHCIGRHVDVRIRVGEDGGIREVEPQDDDVPPDCLRAALDAARRIKFTPGKVDGRPAELWAQVRIDFEEKR